MYNRYRPPDTSFQPIPVEEPSTTATPPHTGQPESKNFQQANKKPFGTSQGNDLLGELTNGIGEVLGKLFENFSLQNLDSGDILLLLIILFLFLEGDNLDLVIALGLMLLLGLGENPQPST